MQSIEYLRTFVRRKGMWMLLANVLTKILGFASVVIATRLTTSVEFGAYSFAFNIIAALVPLMGFGGYQAFLRYSAEAKGQLFKKELYRYAFSRGLALSGVLVFVLWISAPWICNEVPTSVSSFRIVVFVIMTTLLMEYVKSYARALHRNAVSARIDIYYALFLLVGVTLLTYFFGIMGYALAVVVAPCMAISFFVKKLGLLEIQWKPIRMDGSAFWMYGIFTTIGAVLAQMFYAVDIYFIGAFADEDSVALYRIAVIIPIATLVLPVSVAATDFVKNAQNSGNKEGLKHYVLHSWKIFGVLSVIVLFTISLFAPLLLSLFGPHYKEGSDLMRIYLIGSLGAHLLRVPFGNLLSAIGKASWNTYINAAVLLFTAFLCGILLPLYDIRGAAIAMAIMTWVSGLLNAGAFWWYWRGLR